MLTLYLRTTAERWKVKPNASWPHGMKSGMRPFVLTSYNQSHNVYGTVRWWRCIQGFKQWWICNSLQETWHASQTKHQGVRCTCTGSDSSWLSFTALRIKDGFWKDRVAWTPSLALIRGRMLSLSTSLSIPCPHSEILGAVSHFSNLAQYWQQTELVFVQELKRLKVCCA